MSPTPIAAFACRAHRNSSWVLMLAFAWLGTSMGCMSIRGVSYWASQDPMAGAPRLQNAKSTTVPSMDRVVTHLNRNIDPIHGWKTSDVRIHVRGIAIPLSGRLAVERERHVRLEVSSPRGPEFDMGSNDEQIWVWARGNKPGIVTCRHENLDLIRQAEGVPFEPDLLMQALSVAPIAPENMEFETAPTNDEARLVSQTSTAHGRPLRRVIAVDLKHGGIITQHSLYDFNGVPIAAVKLSHHRFDRYDKRDKKAGVVLPHRVVLEWPQNGMSVTMDLGKIEVNPSSCPSEVWVMPKFPKTEVVSLDENVRPGRVAIHPGARVRLDAIDDEESSSEGEKLADEQVDSMLEEALPAGHATLDDEADFSDEVPKKRPRTEMDEFLDADFKD